ncbi:MAG: C39 family peptidase [Anaerolineae bacterium]|nr:C39 family peptidase [Anaerolineae bacterium]
MVQWGININPRHPVGQPSEATALAGVKWVRVVFIVDAAQVSLESAFQTYDDVVTRYNNIGAKVLFVLNQETFWGHGPWDNGDYDRYAREFAERCGQIAAHYKGRGVAYEIWNEGDLVGGASVFVDAKEFAKVLKAVAKAIKDADSKAPVIFGGLAGNDPINYLKTVRKELGNKLPVDAVGIHPYGQWPPNFSGKPAWGGWFGLLSPGLQNMINAFPGVEFWITEIGISEHIPYPPEQFPMVIQYMNGIQDLVAKRYRKNIPNVIWFAWSDGMRNAGIVDLNNQPKSQIFAAFLKVVQAANTEVPPTRDPRFNKPFKVVYRKSLRVRTAPRVETATLIKDRFLTFGEVIYADPNSKTASGDFIWWEHEEGWSAAARVDGTEYLMLPLDANGNVIEPTDEVIVAPPAPPAPEPEPAPEGRGVAPVEEPDLVAPIVTPVTPTPAKIQFRVLIDGLRVRSEPRTGDDTLTNKRLTIGEIVEVEGDSQTTANGFIWWHHSRGWSASRSVDSNQVFMETVEADTGDRKVNILEVPWISQVSATATGAFDCGQTCVLMLLRYYSKVGPDKHVIDLTRLKDGRTTWNDLIELAGLFDLPLALQDVKQNITSLRSKLPKLIDAGKPAILLVYYRDLQLPNTIANPPRADPGLHWLVARGYDGDTFFINDPLWLEEEHRSKYASGMIPVRLDTLNRAYRGAALG